MSPSATLPRKVPRRCHQMVWVRWCETDGVKVDVTNFHACHAKRRWMSPSTTPTTQNEGACRQAPRLPRKVPRRHRRPIRAQARPSAPPSATSVTPATQNEGGCHQMPRLPRKTKMDVTKCHACHAKRRYVSPSATPATQSTAASPATNLGQSAPKRATKRNKCHACHAKRRWMSPNATPATRNEGACRQVPRLPRKTKVDVTKCHTCHVKRRWMSPSATPATGRWCVTKLCVKDGGWQRCVWKMVGNKVVCERWCVTNGV